MDFSTDAILNIVQTYGLPVLKAVAILIIGFWLIGWIKKLAVRAMGRTALDETLKKFLADLIGIVLKAVLFITVLDVFGIKATSLVAILGAAGLAVGLALQGSLANFAGGVMLLLFKPFKVGDLVEAQGHIGVVQAINIFVTTLLTPDNKTVIIPNGPLSNGDITNLSADGKLRVDLVAGIGYNADIKQAKAVIIDVMQNDPKVLKEPAPSVNVLELADSSVNLAIRPWATPDDYWDVYFGITEQVKIALDNAGIEIPFPQRVVHNINA